MFQSLFQFLAGDPLPKGAAITGIALSHKDAQGVVEEAFLKLEGHTDRENSIAIGQMLSRGWKVEGVFSTLDRVPSNAYRTHAAYLKA